MRKSASERKTLTASLNAADLAFGADRKAGR